MADVAPVGQDQIGARIDDGQRQALGSGTAAQADAAGESERLAAIAKQRNKVRLQAHLMNLNMR